MKPWQKGYPLAELLKIQSLYEAQNATVASPFAAVKKNTIASLLHAKRFVVADDFAYELAEVKKRTAIKIYNDEILAQQQPGDFTLRHAIWRPGNHLKLADNLAVNLAGVASGRGTWLKVIAMTAEQRANTQALLTALRQNETIAACVWVGWKITSFGDIYHYWYLTNDIKTVFPVEYSVPRYEHLTVNKASVDFDVSRAKAEVAALDVEYTNHYSNYNAKKAWAALSLRGFFADPARIEKPAEMSDDWHAANGEGPFELQNTPLWDRLEAIRGLVSFWTEACGAQVERVRLMRLAPGGGELKRHTDQVDNDAGVRNGQTMRMHIPLVTNPGVDFTVWNWNNEPTVVNMREGECWVLDTRKPHCVVNRGTTERIHLVIDVFANDAVRALFDVTTPFEESFEGVSSEE
jgi:hypothetical protein